MHGFSSIADAITPNWPEYAAGVDKECCLYTGSGRPKRCRIVKKSNTSNGFLIDCVDTGDRLTASIQDLRVMPLKFYEYPAFAILAELSDSDRLYQHDERMYEIEYFVSSSLWRS